MAGISYSYSNSEINLDISYEALKELLLEVLKAAPIGQTNSLSLYSKVVELAVAKNLVPNTYPPGSYHINQNYTLSEKDQMMIHDIFWDFVVDGIVRPGITFGNKDFPNYHVTKKGEQIIADS